MQIKITQCCGVHGEVVEVDEILEVDDPTGKLLIGIGKAEPYEAPAPAPKMQNADPKGQNQDPKITNQDPKP
jgi:hypothetical protein